MAVCGDCGGTVIEYDAAAGNGFCVGCGTVVEENTIVSEVVFGESSSGAAIVQGSFVGQGATRARMSGPYGNRNSSESREQTIENASRKIRNVSTVMRLSEVVQTAAVRLYTLALEHKFTKGRKSMNVVAVCLYVACRQKETRNYMLIDFSDLLQVNVFELGHIYLQLVQTLNLRLPLVDPSHYISRFAALLEFGDETPRVAADAVRLVARMDRDWMTRGRRPAGICGACLLLAARMNNFRRSVQEVVQVVKIADTTLKKRLDEFRKTPSGTLTLADFRTVWLEDEVDPPAYTKAREKEAKKRASEAVYVSGGEAEDEGEEVEGETKRMTRSRKRKRAKGGRKRRRVHDDDDITAVLENGGPAAESSTASTSQIPIDPQLLNERILSGSAITPLFLPDPSQEVSEIPTLVPNERSSSQTAEKPDKNAAEDDEVEAALRDEVTEILHNPQGSQLADALEEADQRRRSHFTDDDELLGLDDSELDAFILSEEEVRIKERVWVEMNRDYLVALAAKEAAMAGSAPPKSRKKRKTDNKPRDASTPSGSTAIDAVQSMIKKSSKYSRRINYDALRNLFASDTAAAIPEDLAPPKEVDLDEKEDDMYTIDDKSDGEGMMMNVVVVEEESGGGVGVTRRPSGPGDRTQADASRDAQSGPEQTEEEDGEGEEIELGEKGEYDYGWDEGYQQEV